MDAVVGRGSICHVQETAMPGISAEGFVASSRNVQEQLATMGRVRPEGVRFNKKGSKPAAPDPVAGTVPGSVPATTPVQKVVPQ